MKSQQVLDAMEPVLTDSGELESIRLPWVVGRSATSSFDNTVNGYLHIGDSKLVIDVNSHERAASIQRKVKRRLGKLATLVSFEQSPDWLPDSPVNEPLDTDTQQELMNNPAVQQHIEALSRKHWDDWLDHPLPALDGLAPREAAKSARGRELLDAVFDDFSSREGQHPEGSPTDAFKPPIGKLRKALGLA